MTNYRDDEGRMFAHLDRSRIEEAVNELAAAVGQPEEGWPAPLVEIHVNRGVITTVYEVNTNHVPARVDTGGPSVWAKVDGVIARPCWSTATHAGHEWIDPAAPPGCHDRFSCPGFVRPLADGDTVDFVWIRDADSVPTLRRDRWCGTFSKVHPPHGFGYGAQCDGVTVADKAFIEAALPEEKPE